ncbi:MAG: secretin and TonB N-terminal domain-containing protein, partial [Lepagella sp.]
MKRIVWLILCILAVIPVSAQRVTLKADNVQAATAFRSLMEQSGKNFVYSSDLLKGLRVTIDVRNKPLNKVLKHMFRGTDIEFSIKGRQVILKRRPRPKTPPLRREVPRQAPKSVLSIPDSVHIHELPEVEVISRLEESPLESVEIGARKLSAEDILNTPTLLGEADVVKALQAQPGVVSGTDGFAGMYVHGGNTDENMYMLDNVPLYQVNHFAGLFSAFNTEAIRYIDFFKSSIPARYDGRLA